MQSVEFFLSPSRLLLSFLWGLALLTASTLFFFSFPILLQLAGLCLLFYSIKKIKQHHVTRTAQTAIVKIWQESNGNFCIETNAGVRAKGHLRGDSFKCPLFILCRLDLRQRIVTILIPRDALTEEAFRLLKARMCVSV